MTHPGELHVSNNYLSSRITPLIPVPTLITKPRHIISQPAGPGPALAARAFIVARGDVVAMHHVRSVHVFIVRVTAPAIRIITMQVVTTPPDRANPP